MRVLSVAWDIQDDRIPAFKGVLTGAGVVIRNICEYIGEFCESYVLIGKYPIEECQVGRIHYLSNGLTNEKISQNEIRLQSDIDAFRKAIITIKPDVVNFHGTGDFICACIHICKSLKIPFVVTCHLFIGVEQEIPQYDIAIKYEKELFGIKDINYIAVGTGMKKKILRDFPAISPGNITVIPNGTNYKSIAEDKNVRKQLGIGDEKILILAGTINYRKNQLQVVRAFDLLEEEIKRNLKILFCGRDAMNGLLQESISEKGLEDSLIYIGAIPVSEMKRYYSIADGYIMPSLAEGLSISALEALRFGLPQIMFSDSECAEDLNDDEVTILIPERSDRALACAIETWYTKKWNKEYVKKYSDSFSMERVASDYIKYYKNLVEVTQ